MSFHCIFTVLTPIYLSFNLASRDAHFLLRFEFIRNKRSHVAIIIVWQESGYE